MADLGAHSLLETRLTAVELDDKAADESRAALRPFELSSRVHCGDFFSFVEALSPEERFDAVLGNPPFLRFQYFKEEHREAAFRIMRRQGLHPNKLTNAWVPFVVAASSLLSNYGRLAMVIPAELLQVSYAAELRRFMSEFFERITVFSFEKLLFDGIEQEVVLLTAERKSNNPGIRVVELTDADDLRGQSVDAVMSPLKAMDHGTEKWIQYFLAPDELELVRSLRSDQRLMRLGELASVDVGVVTGMNDFFVLPASGKSALALRKYLTPIVTRSHQLTGCRFTNKDWQELVDAEGAGMLLSLKDSDVIQDDVLVDLLEGGIQAGITAGYKCRIRKKWYVVPSVWRPSGFMLRQIHRYPKLVLNGTPATSTDTVHRVAFASGVNPDAVVSSFYNSATFLFSEVLGRSYGGGVLELEPSEAEAMPIPFSPDGSSWVAEFDTVLRGRDAERVLDMGDYRSLTRLGMSSTDIATIRRAWLRLRNRRLGRNRLPGNRVQPDAQLVASG